MKHLGLVRRCPVKRGLRGTSRPDASRDVRADRRVALSAHSGSRADAAGIRESTPKQGRSRAGGHVAECPACRPGSGTDHQAGLAGIGVSRGHGRRRSRQHVPAGISLAALLSSAVATAVLPRRSHCGLSPASPQTVEAGSYARPGNPPIARSRTPSGPGRILRRAVGPTRMMWSSSSLYRWPSTCTSAEPRSAI